MKHFIVLGAVTAALSGCTSGACDTGDSACKSTTTNVGTPFLESILYDCGGGNSCTWSVEASGGQIGLVDLYLAETGDTSGGCQTDPNCSDEGFWTESHNNFSLVGSSGGIETKSITLDIVSSYADQAQNTSTLFDMTNTTIEAQLTYMASITDSAGAFASCYAFGDDPSYFASLCGEI